MWKWTIVWAAIGAATATASACDSRDGAANSRTFQRLKKPNIPQPEAVQFVGSTFSTDLPLAESKQPVHRLWLNCRLADGGSGVLTLDPNVLKFDKFGDQVGVVQPTPLVRLDFILKLIKKEKHRTLYEIRGPKIVSRFSFVAYRDITPWGDGRLLVHGKGGEVRYVIDLFVPRPPPAKPAPAVKLPPP